MKEFHLYYDAQGAAYSLDRKILYTIPNGIKDYTVQEGTKYVNWQKPCDVENLTLPATLCKIYDNAYFLKLQNFTTSGGNWEAMNGILTYRKGECVTLIHYPLGRKDENTLITPEGIRPIDKAAIGTGNFLKEIILPTFFETFNNECFCRCEHLEALKYNNEHFKDINGVLFSADLTRRLYYPINKRPFFGEYTIPESVREIEASCFHNNDTFYDNFSDSDIAFEKIILPPWLSEKSLDELPPLKHISCKEGNFKDIDGVLFMADKKALVYHPLNNDVGKVSQIPNGTEEISHNSSDKFWWYRECSRLILPDSLVYLLGLLSCCGELVIPHSVCAIGAHIFMLNHFNKFIISTQITKLPISLFQYCHCVDIIINSPIKKIKKSCFENSSIYRLVFTNLLSEVEIDDSTFEDTKFTGYNIYGVEDLDAPLNEYEQCYIYVPEEHIELFRKKFPPKCVHKYTPEILINNQNN